MKSRATVICRKDDLILYVRKPKSRWALPGGKIENGELPADAAVRELEEETGLAVEDLVYLARYQKDGTTHFVFLCNLASADEPIPANEISECKWQQKKRVQKLNASPATKAIVKAFAAFKTAC